MAGDQLQCACIERACECGLDELGHLRVGEALQAQHVRHRERRMVRPRGREDEDRALRLREHAREHLDQGFGRPVQVLHDHDRGPPRAEL